MDGRLQILEANPKPDLKRPKNGTTNLISAGLPDFGMDYEDLILSLFADRLDCLLKHRKSSIGHIVDLLNSNSHPVRESGRRSAVLNSGTLEPASSEDQDLNEAVTNANVRVLEDLISSAENTAKADPLPTSKGPSTRRSA